MLTVAAIVAAGLLAGFGLAYGLVRATTPAVDQVEVALQDEAASPAPVMRAVAAVAQQGPEATFARMASAPVAGARELDCLTQAVYFEARGETPRGQAAVAQVVLNRVRHPAFPKSVCGVVYQGAGDRGCQFSFACRGTPGVGRESAAWRKARRVARDALAGVVVAEVGAATHFHTTGVTPAWGSRLLRVAQVGVHVFYRLGASAPRAVFASRPVETAAADAVFTGAVVQPASAEAALAPEPALAPAEAAIKPEPQAAPVTPASAAAPAPTPAAGTPS